MRGLLMIGALLGAMLMGLGATTASAAPAAGVIAGISTEIGDSQSLVEQVGQRRGYCHWHKKCGWKRVCWWKHGYRHCGWKWRCRTWCHKHWHKRRIYFQVY